jgi:hypothetical protein
MVTRTEYRVEIPGENQHVRFGGEGALRAATKLAQALALQAAFEEFRTLGFGRDYACNWLSNRTSEIMGSQEWPPTDPTGD